MRRAKIVEIPDRELSLKEFDDLWRHAYNSASWYADKYHYSRARIRQKLLDKGYKDEPVTYCSGEIKEHCDIIENVLDNIESKGIFQEDNFLEDKVWALMSSGKSVDYVLDTMERLKFPESKVVDVIDDYMSCHPDHEEQAVIDAALSIVGKPSFQALDYRKQQRRFLAGMFRKRINFTEANEWMDQNSQYFNHEQ